MKKSYFLLFGILSSSFFFSGCINENFKNIPTAEEVRQNLFDFSTTQNVNFEVNYGEKSSNALIELYLQNPIVIDEENESYKIEGEAVFKTFLDSNGHFSENITIPTNADKVYLYSHNWSTPTLIETSVINGKISFDANSVSSRASALNVLKDNLSYKEVNQSQKLYTITDWNRYGRAYGETDFNGIFSDGDMTPELIANTQQFLWKGSTSKPNGLNNSIYLSDTKNTNTTINSVYVDDEGKTHTVENAQVWMTAMTEGAWNENVFGYYYYKSDEVPSSPADVEKFIIFPNFSVSNLPPYGVWGDKYYDASNAPVKRNQRAQLLFKKEDGKMTPYFPAGYTIGYFIISNGFGVSSNDNIPGSINMNQQTIKRYSNAEWNSGSLASCCISLAASDGTYVYGFEDSNSDKSYEDALFVISADPSYAIKKTDNNLVINTSKTEETEAVQTNIQTYAFEDMWPTGGDYDLNDVIVEHTQKITFNSKNYVKSIVDEFKFVQPNGAAANINAFAVICDPLQRGVLTLPEESIDETETNSIIISTNTNSSREKTYTVERKFENNTLLKSNVKPLSPYIINSYEKGAEQRIEVHMPKIKPTSKAKLVNDNLESAYYVKSDGIHPYALTLPIVNFKPTTEKVNIESEYPDFTKWVESKGASNCDWYLNYKSSVK